MSLSHRQRYVELCLEAEVTVPRSRPRTPGDVTPSHGERQALTRVAEQLEVEEATLTGRCRSALAVRQRQAAMWLLKRSGLSAAAIGRALGRNHSTVLHGLSVVEARREVDAQLAGRLDGLAERGVL